jgi:hypothetical protein
MKETPAERFDELNYNERPKRTACLDEISLSLEQKIYEEADILEWRLGIHEKLLKKGTLRGVNY